LCAAADPEAASIEFLDGCFPFSESIQKGFPRFGRHVLKELEGE
jgi:hypothetical protein